MSNATKPITIRNTDPPPPPHPQGATATFGSENRRSRIVLANTFLKRYQPAIWNTDPHITNSHNCYAYFLNKIDPTLREECRKTNCDNRNKLKPQPGHYSRKHHPIGKRHHLYTCRNMVKRVLDDNPHVYRTTKAKPCPKDYYKGALAVDPGNTYHFYRQDRDMTWSHKDGSFPATNVDASGKPIIDVEQANRDYGYRKEDKKVINYTDFCGYFCIPTDPDKKFMARITADTFDTFLENV